MTVYYFKVGDVVRRTKFAHSFSTTKHDLGDIGYVTDIRDGKTNDYIYDVKFPKEDESQWVSRKEIELVTGPTNRKKALNKMMELKLIIESDKNPYNAEILDLIKRAELIYKDGKTVTVRVWKSEYYETNVIGKIHGMRLKYYSQPGAETLCGEKLVPMSEGPPYWTECITCECEITCPECKAILEKEK